MVTVFEDEITVDIVLRVGLVVAVPPPLPCVVKKPSTLFMSAVGTPEISPIMNRFAPSLAMG